MGKVTILTDNPEKEETLKLGEVRVIVDNWQEEGYIAEALKYMAENIQQKENVCIGFKEGYSCSDTVEVVEGSYTIFSNEEELLKHIKVTQEKQTKCWNEYQKQPIKG